MSNSLKSRALPAMLVCVGLVAVAFALPAAAAPNLVQNGSFENGYPASTNGPWWQSVGYGGFGGSLIPGWTETAGGVDWHKPGPFGEPVAQDGSRVVDLNGSPTTAGGRIEQNVATTAGALYTLSFHYAGHVNCMWAHGRLTVSATASAGTSSLVVTSARTNVYTPAALTFTGAAGSTTIAFASNHDFLCGGVLVDSVSVAQVLPTTADDCKRGGWVTFGVFKNQGDCVSFIATGGTNPSANG